MLGPFRCPARSSSGAAVPEGVADARRPGLEPRSTPPPAREGLLRPMADTSDTFKKAPKRKPSKGKSVAVSPEMRQAYADLIKEREAKQEGYERHLRQDEPKRR
jgi:hypothetical protein